MKETKITVETTVNADKRKAWDYWTIPEHISKWNFPSDDWHCPKAENDLRKGGKFNYRMASKDNKVGFDFEGVYDEVADRKKIAYSMPDGRQVEVNFESVGDKTKLTETFDPEKTNPEDMQRSGWQAILDNFKKHVETE